MNNSGVATSPFSESGRHERLISLDALRGFDMLWIVGADDLFDAMNKIGAPPETNDLSSADEDLLAPSAPPRPGIIPFIANQLQHVKWTGFHFEDLIFPLFVFMMGTAIVFSLGKIVASEGKARAHARLFRRFVLLYLIGIFYYGGFSKLWPGIRLVGVLQRIALCYFFAGILFLNFRLRGMIIACAAFLIGYWALMSFVPAPGMSHVSFSPNENWANYIDRNYLPGRLYDKTWDPEGLLSTIPAVSTALLGVFAGLLLKNRNVPEMKKVLYLLGAGVAGVLLGYLWGLQFPIIKKLWTSSYVLVAGGYSAILLGIFYLVIDVWKFRKWATPFLWIGVNALAIYLASNLIEFERIARRFVGGDIKEALGIYGDLVIATVSLGLVILFAWFLNRKRVYIRL